MLRQDEGWTNPKVLAVFTVIFLFGAALGAAGMREYLHARITQEIHFKSQTSIEAANRLGLQRLKTALNLTPQQEKTVERELDEWGKYYQNIEEQRADIEDQRANVAEMGRQRILNVLDENQKRRFNEMLPSTAHR